MKETIKVILKQRDIKRIVEITLGILGAMALCYTLPTAHLQGRNSVLYTNSTHSFLFVAMAAYLYVTVRSKIKEEKRRRCLAVLLALLFSAFLVIGARLESLDNFNVTEVSNYLIILFSGIFLYPFIELSWQWLNEKKKKGIARREEKGSLFLRNWLIIFLCWLPVFLAFYPGAFVYSAVLTCSNSSHAS